MENNYQKNTNEGKVFNNEHVHVGDDITINNQFSQNRYDNVHIGDDGDTSTKSLDRKNVF